MAIKINLKTKPSTTDDGGDEILRVRASEFINGRVESYGRGYTDGLISAGLVAGGTAAAVLITHLIMGATDKKK